MAQAATGQTPLFDELTSWRNLYRAARKTRLGKRQHFDTARFELERERELLILQDELRTRTYRPGKYRSFYVREPGASYMLIDTGAGIGMMPVYPRGFTTIL